MTDKEKWEVYYPLVHTVVNKLFQTNGYYHLRQHRDDLISEGAVGLKSGIETYDPNAGSTEVSWYSRKILTYVLNYIKCYERVSPGRDISIDDIQIEAECIPYEDPDYELIDKYEPESELKQAIYHQILMGNSTYREVAEQFGTTRGTVKTRKKELVKKLREQMTNDGVLEDLNED